jgi:hypothetical protein
MLAQLLERRGIPTRRVFHTAVSRGAIAQLDVSGVSVIALSYLELSGSPAHLRYVIKRLRQRAPGAAIVVGLWPEGDAVRGETAALHTLGADRYVGSLSEAIEASLALLPAAEHIGPQPVSIA